MTSEHLGHVRKLCNVRCFLLELPYVAGNQIGRVGFYVLPPRSDCYQGSEIIFRSWSERQTGSRRGPFDILCTNMARNPSSDNSLMLQLWSLTRPFSLIAYLVFSCPVEHKVYQLILSDSIGIVGCQRYILCSSLLSYDQQVLQISTCTIHSV